MDKRGSPMARENWVQSQVESYQRLKKWYLMPPCLTLSIIRYGSRVKWSNPEKGVAPSPTPWCSKLSKRQPSGHPRLWSPTLLLLLLTYLETKSFKTVQAKFRRKFNLINYSQKSQIHSWVHKLQTTGSVNNFSKKVKNPKSCKKLTARCPDNVDAVRDSARKRPKKSLRRRYQVLGLLEVPVV